MWMLRFFTNESGGLVMFIPVLECFFACQQLHKKRQTGKEIAQTDLTLQPSENSKYSGVQKSESSNV